MKELVVFGTGESANKVVKAISPNTKIKAFIDNNHNKQGKYIFDTLIISPTDIEKYEFDYILVAIIKYQQVEEQLLKLGVEANKIINFFDTDIIYHENIESILRTDVLLKINYERQMYELKNIIQNMPYEIADRVKQNNFVFPHVKTIDETIDDVIQKKRSISRFGDGEIMLIAGKNIGFQKASNTLLKRLHDVLVSDLENHMVGILNVFGDLSCYTESMERYFRDYLNKYKREYQYSLLDMKKTYYDAFITRPYISYKDKSLAQQQFKKIKSIWENRDIIIVEGERTKLGIGNDLFDSVKSCQRIECPSENAFECYDSILEEVLKIDLSKLILIALGPTATILAYDLAKAGYQAIDIGHIDIEYEWFLMGAIEKEVIKNKYTNEAYGGNMLSESNEENESFESQVISCVDACLK